MDVAGVDPTLKLRDPERVFYPLAITTKATTSPLLGFTASTTPTQAKDQLPEPDVKATITSTNAKKAPSPSQAPSTVEANVSAP